MGLNGWYKGAEVAEKDGNHWVHLTGRGSAAQNIPLEPHWFSLTVSCRMRLTDVAQGDEGWHDARLVMSFNDADGEHVDPWPNVFHGTGTTGWQRYERTFIIPNRAHALRLGPAMFARSGTAEFDDVVVRVRHTRTSVLKDLPPPAGAGDAWGMADAQRQVSPARSRLCLNGLWQFRPMMDSNPADAPPGPNQAWGWFKVPGIWPDRPKGEAQEVFLSPYFQGLQDLRRMDRAWQARRFVCPPEAEGRRVMLDLTLIQTHARIFIDGREAGEVWFPGGRCDLTDHVRPGAEHTLAILVTARPLWTDRNAFMDPGQARKQKVHVRNRGLTGDMYLVTEPRGDVLGDVHVITSTRKGTVAIDTRVRCGTGERRLAARILDRRGAVAKTFASKPFTAADLEEGRFTFSAGWPDADRWDLHTPGNVYDAIVTLTDSTGRVLDESLPVRFGFREFWIDGQDFVLNGTRAPLRALSAHNNTRPADIACLDACRRTCQAIKGYGFNAFITSNYDFAPGSVGYAPALYEAADEAGLLCSFSLPHVKDVGGHFDDPKRVALYRARAEYLIRRIQNHPSIVMYAMNHNYCGYHGDQDPLKIDGRFTPDPDPMNKWKPRHRQAAETARGIAADIDPTRPTYHHQSGHLGVMHTVNCYLNWAPRQERSQWLGHWNATGVKPLFFVEWGLPHISSWSSFRGPAFIWRTEAFQRIWDAEFTAAYVGPAAYRMTEIKQRSLDHEEDLWARGKPFRWSSLIRDLREQTKNHLDIKTHFAADNWRSHRTWAVSAMLPWDQGDLWQTGPDFDPATVPNPDALKNLKQPGIVPDNLTNPDDYRYTRQPEAMEPTVLGRTFLRWNRPLLAYIGGGEAPGFVDKAHNYVAGTPARNTVDKQIVLLNDTREPANAHVIAEGPDQAMTTDRTLAPGAQARVPFPVLIAKDDRPGAYTMTARIDFGKGRVQTDAFTYHVLPPPPACRPACKVALFDPKGYTARMLDGLGVAYTKVDAASDLADYGLLVIGREAVGMDNALPDLTPVRDGLKALVFEQTAEVLQNRLGFRINVHGLRRVFARVPDHPALAGLEDAHLQDWRGQATLVPPYLENAGDTAHDPQWEWCGYTNTRVWRCRNRGCVASVLTEKPPRGNWLPIVDGGFDLQYAPLLECTVGKGRLVFCQLDVTARTEEDLAGNRRAFDPTRFRTVQDPAAERIVRNLLTYLDRAEPAAHRSVYVAGDRRTLSLLDTLGVPAKAFTGQEVGSDDLLVLGPAGGQPDMDMGRGVHVLCLGLSETELDRITPESMTFKTAETYSHVIEDFSEPAFRGLSNADLHWRTTLTLPLLRETTPLSCPSLRAFEVERGRVVLCQAAPWMFDTKKKPYLRTTRRRSLFLVSRLLGNLGAALDPGLLQRFAGKGTPDATAENGPWLTSYYVQKPVADDDPYRYYRW